MKNLSIKKARVAQNQVHYITDAKYMRENEIVWAIAQQNQNRHIEYEIDGDELIEYSFNRGMFTRWVVMNVRDNKVILSSI